MRIAIVAVMSCVAMALGVIPAASAIVDVSYSGVITSVYDPTGQISSIFGSDNLIGDRYVAHYIFNTNLGQTFTSPTLSYAYGGGYYGTATPLIGNSITVTINDQPQTYSVGNTNADEIEACGSNACLMNASAAPNKQYDLAEHKQGTTGSQTISYIQSMVATYNSGAFPISITTPFVYNIAPGDDAYSQLVFGSCASACDSKDAVFVFDEIEVDSISTLTVTTTPLPAAWTVFVVGLAGIAAFGRPRRNYRAI